MSQTSLEKINFLVSHAKADVNLCVAAFQIIKRASVEDRADLLEIFIRGFRNRSTDGTLEIPEVMSSETEHTYLRRYQRIVDGHLEELLNAGLSKEEFYVELTKYIMEDKNLMDDGARAIAIYDCCIDKRLPYANVDLSSGLKMENSEYAECVELLGDETIDRIRYILNANLQQRTEKASLLLLELETCEDFKLKTVMLSTILNHYDAEAFRKAWLQTKLATNHSLLDMLSDD